MSRNRFALIIANDQYEDESLSKLEAPKFDAYALAEVLGDPVTSNFYVQLAVNKKAHTVNQLIEAFFDNRKRDDLLLLYFSGHGVKDEDGKLYFATPNTRRDRLRSTAISASLVNDMMRITRSRSQILLLDCCYSGAFAKGMIAKSGSAIGSKIGTNDYFQGRGRIVLTASDSMQYAFEEDKLVEKGSVNSIFTSAIVEGIKTWEADSNGDNRISIQELYDYVEGYIQERTPNQQPVMWSFNTQGEMIIAERDYAPELDDEEIEVYEPVAQYPEETQPPVRARAPDVQKIRLREAQIQYEAKLEALHQHANDLTESTSIEMIAEYTIEVMYATLGMKSCDFYILEEQHLRLINYRGWIPENPNQKFPLDGPGILVKTANTKKTNLISDIRKEPDYLDYRGTEVEGEDEYQPLSELCVPVISNGEVVAILNTESNRLNFYDERDQILLETLASHVASAIQRIRLLEEQIQYKAKLERASAHVEIVHEEVEPPSQVQISAELVRPFLEEPSDSRKLPVKPVILVAIILVVVIGLAYWSGIGPFNPATDDNEGGDTQTLLIEDFSAYDLTLSWRVSGATSTSIDQGIGSVESTGSISVSPTETTTYTLTASNNESGRYVIEQVVVEKTDDPVFKDFLNEPNIITLTYYDLSDTSTPDHYELELLTIVQNISAPIDYVKVIFPEDINGESEHQLFFEPSNYPPWYFKHLIIPSQVTGEFIFEVGVNGEMYQDTFYVSSNSYCQYTVDISSPQEGQHFGSSDDLVFNWITDQTDTAEQFIRLYQGTDHSQVYEDVVYGPPLDYDGSKLYPGFYDLEIEIWTRAHGDILINGRIYIDGNTQTPEDEGARIVVMNRGGDINDLQLNALQLDFPNIDWVPITGEIEEAHLNAANMLILSQDDLEWGYESWEIDYIKNWLSLGEKTIWVTSDSDYDNEWKRQIESNYILEGIGSSLRVESCAVSDHESYAGTYGDPPLEATYRVLGTPHTNYEGFLTGVSSLLFHGPGAIIGTDGSSYYDLVSSKPPSTTISVLMTTSTNTTENGYIDDYDSIAPELHTTSTFNKAALMVVEELDSNLVIVTGASIYGHFNGLYKPELRAVSEYIQELYTVEFPTQGDVLLSNILDYVINNSS